MNIIPNLRNGYLREYQKTLYQLKEDDYIGTQDGINIYNVLGKNNDNADFNMILTAIGGIYDNRLLIKIVDTNKKYNMDEQIPYESAKTMYLVDDIDNKELLKEIVLGY